MTTMAFPVEGVDAVTVRVPQQNGNGIRHTAEKDLSLFDEVALVWDVLPDEQRTTEVTAAAELLRQHHLPFLKLWRKGQDEESITIEDAVTVHRLMTVGNTNIACLPVDASRDIVKRARRGFVRLLDPTELLEKSLRRVIKNDMPRPEHIVNFSLLCGESGADPRTALLKCPNLAFNTADNTRQHMQELHQLGATKSKMVLENAPQALQNMRASREVVKLLDDYGVTSMLADAPEILTWETHVVQDRLDAYEANGFNTRLMAQKCPRQLLDRPELSERKVRVIAYGLRKLGVDTEEVDSIVDKIKEQPRYVTGLNINRLKDYIRLLGKHSSSDDYEQFEKLVTARLGRDKQEIDPVRAAIRALYSVPPNQLAAAAETSNDGLLIMARDIKNQIARQRKQSRAKYLPLPPEE